MKDPPYPGDAVREDCLEPMGLSVAKAARVLGVPVGTLNSLFYGKCGISPEMAIRLDKAFGGTAEAWLALQTAYDLAQARKNEPSITVERYEGKGASPRGPIHERPPRNTGLSLDDENHPDPKERSLLTPQQRDALCRHLNINKVTLWRWSVGDTAVPHSAKLACQRLPDVPEFLKLKL